MTRIQIYVTLTVSQERELHENEDILTTSTNVCSWQRFVQVMRNSRWSGQRLKTFLIKMLSNSEWKLTKRVIQH